MREGTQYSSVVSHRKAAEIFFLLVICVVAFSAVAYVLVKEFHASTVSEASTVAVGVATKGATTNVLNTLSNSKAPLNPVIASKQEVADAAKKIKADQARVAADLKRKTEATAKEVEGKLQTVQAAQMQRYHALKDQLDRIERKQDQYFQTQPLIKRH